MKKKSHRLSIGLLLTRGQKLAVFERETIHPTRRSDGMLVESKGLHGPFEILVARKKRKIQYGSPCR